MSRAQVISVVSELNRFTSRLCAKIALDAHANLVEATPVDTGWARANWVPSIGTPAGPAQPEGVPAPDQVTGAQAQASAGQIQLAGYSIDLGRIYISNGVPYIEKLNAGSSQQAPEGFVERAIDKAVRQDILTVGT